MHPRLIAQRTAQAHGRVLTAIQRIAVNLGIKAPDLASIHEKSPDVQRVKEWEMLAEWTEALVNSTVKQAKTLPVEDRRVNAIAQPATLARVEAEDKRSAIWEPDHLTPKAPKGKKANDDKI